MIHTARFREQHRDLLELAEQISTHLNEKELKADPNTTRSLVSTLLGKLNVHLAMEDKSLYPLFEAQEDEKLRALARKYVLEMGDLAKGVTAYKKQFPNAESVQKRPRDFMRQTRQLFAALKTRIEREDKELFVIAENLKEPA